MAFTPEQRRAHRRENPKKVREADLSAHARWYARNPIRAKEISRNSARKRRRDPVRGKKELDRNRQNIPRRAQKIAAFCGHRVEIPTRPMSELCESCNQKPTGKRNLSLDHCHKTGRFLGWVCHGCNTGGGITDSIELLKLKIVYLERAAAQIAATPDSEVRWAYPRRQAVERP
jgi:hypothetical protein